MNEQYARDLGYRTGDNTNPPRDGYEVEYEGGYKSWTPEKVFVDSYKLIKVLPNKLDVYNKSPIEYNMMIEARQLEVKISELEKDIKENKIPKTNKITYHNEKTLLKQQLMGMKYYLTILVERIENFKN